MATTMKYRDLAEKQIFTWWDRDYHHIGVKIGDRQAFCLDRLEVVDVHYNKDVKELDKIDETLQYKVGRNGHGYLCSPMQGGKVLARRVLLVGGEIMRKDDLKDGKQASAGEHPENAEQVYIMYQLALKKLSELEKVLSVVGIMIADGLSVGSSDNRIMSTGDDPRRLIGQLQ